VGVQGARWSPPLGELDAQSIPRLRLILSSIGWVSGSNAQPVICSKASM
jgi:hypothetical protein